MRVLRRRFEVVHCGMGGLGGYRSWCGGVKGAGMGMMVHGGSGLRFEIVYGDDDGSDAEDPEVSSISVGLVCGTNMRGQIPSSPLPVLGNSFMSSSSFEDDVDGTSVSDDEELNASGFYGESDDDLAYDAGDRVLDAGILQVSLLPRLWLEHVANISHRCLAVAPSTSMPTSAAQRRKKSPHASR